MSWRPKNSNVQLPAILKCDDCKKGKKHEQYATNRLQKLKDAGGDRSRVRLVCLECTGGGPKTELKCHRCDQVKVITKFAKTQRSKDEPECEQCTKERLADDDDDCSDQGGYSSPDEEDVAYYSDDDPGEGPWAKPSTLPSITASTAPSLHSGGVALSTAPSTIAATTNSRPQPQNTKVAKKAEPVVTQKEEFKHIAAQLSDSDSD